MFGKMQVETDGCGWKRVETGGNGWMGPADRATRKTALAVPVFYTDPYPTEKF